MSEKQPMPSAAVEAKSEGKESGSDNLMYSWPRLPTNILYAEQSVADKKEKSDLVGSKNKT